MEKQPLFCFNLYFFLNWQYLGSVISLSSSSTAVRAADFTQIELEGDSWLTDSPRGERISCSLLAVIVFEKITKLKLKNINEKN